MLLCESLILIAFGYPKISSKLRWLRAVVMPILDVYFFINKESGKAFLERVSILVCAALPFVKQQKKIQKPITMMLQFLG
jgi:hypothetical protein